MKKFLLTEVNLDDPKYLVRRRLDFVKKLNSLSEKFDDIKDITGFGDRGFIYESFQDYQALRFYLLLTCFDVLGQCEEYNDFTKWIEEINNPARDKLIKSLSKESPLEICRKINEEYNKIYGTRKSFYRFINSVMSESNKALLLESILIRKIGSGSDLFKDENGKTTKDGEREKLKFLFGVRNMFTHKAHSIASAGAPISIAATGNEEGRMIDYEDGKEKCGYSSVFRDKKFDYHVRRWPSLLIEIIEDALNGYAPYWNPNK